MLNRSVLENILGQVTTGAKDLNSQVDQKLGNNAGLAKGAALGGVAGLLLGGMKTKHLVRAGGAAALGALAYKALSNSSGNAAPAAQPAPGQGGIIQSVPHIDHANEPTDGADEDRQTKLFLSAMITAANADGHITKEEKSRITEALETMNVSTEARLFLLDEMMAPKPMREVAKLIQNDVEAGEVYLLSSMVLDKDDAVGKTYLENLAMVLGLTQANIQALEAAAVEM